MAYAVWVLAMEGEILWVVVVRTKAQGLKLK